MSGLGLEPRWLLNRLKTKTGSIDTKYCGHAPQIIPCQVLRKAEDDERATAVETDKKKEEVAQASCWKGFLLSGLQGTGEPLMLFSWELLLLKTKMHLFFFRAVHPARPYLFCCGALHRRRHLLLQAGCLISLCFLAMFSDI